MHIKSYCQCFDYEINRDYLTNEKSTFTLSEAVNAEYGDFVLVKRSNDINNFLYCGVIDSFTENSMVTCDLYNIVNFEFAATRKTGSSSTGGFGGHIKNLLDIYLDNSKSIYGLTYTLDDSAKVAYSYQPSSPPTVTNMVDYLVNGFKKYNVTFEFDKIKTNSDNSIEIKMVIKKRNDRIQIKNNNYSFVNWDVYENDGGHNLENELLIIDKLTTNSENPIVLSTYYLTKDGQITQVLNDNVRKPTKTKIYIYDSSQADAPSFLEVAQSELAGNVYSHEINVDMLKNNNILDESSIQIGLLANIIYGQTLYQSVLTGYLISSQNDFIQLKFGNIRSTLKEVLK